VCITTYEPDTKSNPNPNPNPKNIKKINSLKQCLTATRPTSLD